LSKPGTSSITGTRSYSEVMLVEPEAAECFARRRSLEKPPDVIAKGTDDAVGIKTPHFKFRCVAARVTDQKP